MNKDDYPFHGFLKEYRSKRGSESCIDCSKVIIGEKFNYVGMPYGDNLCKKCYFKRLDA